MTVVAQRKSSQWYWLLALLILPLMMLDRDQGLKIVGFSRAKLLRISVTQEDETLGQSYIESIRNKQFQRVEQNLSPELRTSETHEQLESASQMFVPGDPLSAKLVDARIFRSHGSTTSYLTFEYELAAMGGPVEESPRQWLLAQVVLEKTASQTTIAGLHVTPIIDPIEITNAFTLAGKGFSQYLGLFLVISVTGLGLYAFVACWRTQGLERKWLWLVLIPFGFFKFTLNWANGNWLVTPLSFQIPPGSAYASPYGPWLLQVHLPIAAVIFLLRGRALNDGIGKENSTSAPLAADALADGSNHPVS